MMSLATEQHAHRPVSIVAIGAGNRATKYLRYIFDNPDRVRLVAVVDPVDVRRMQVARRAGLPDCCCFAGMDEFIAAGVSADAVMICTPEHMHYVQCMTALRHGYHILLEKPIACTVNECREIADEACRRGLCVSVCHVLRHQPYFERLKSVVADSRLGRMLSISHTASVGLDRYVHTYVRGVVGEVNPVLLSKCCHDIDILVWLSGGSCRRLTSYGSRSFFRRESAPEGASSRCIGCAVECSCPFSAVDLYQRRREWIANFDVLEGETVDNSIERQLRQGRFGRCVFDCDNRGVDHQVLAMEMDNGVTVNMSMDCMTVDDGRVTHICMTGGEVHGDERHITVRYFDGHATETYDFTDISQQPFHAGADLKIVEEFINALLSGTFVTRTDIAESLESHRICFEAEKSRLGM